MLPTKFHFICPSSFRGKVCLEINQSETRIFIGGMFVNRSKRNEQSLQRTFHRCCLPSFGPFGRAVSEEKIFRNRLVRNNNCLWQPCLLIDQDKMSSLYRIPPIYASCQVSVHLAKWFQRRRGFRNRPIRNKNCLWRPCLLMDQDEMNNFYTGPSIDASYQISVHLAKRLKRRSFLEIDQS